MSLTLLHAGPLVHPFTVIDTPQRSPAWFEARLGRQRRAPRRLWEADEA